MNERINVLCVEDFFYELDLEFYIESLSFIIISLGIRIFFDTSKMQ